MDVIYPLALAAALAAAVIFATSRGLPVLESRWLVRIAIIALLLRFLAAAMFAMAPDTRIFHEDADGYEYLGMQQALGWHGQGPPIVVFGDQNYGYRYATAALYYAFGQYRPLASFINCVIGVATMTLVYRMARIFFHELVAKRAALLLAFMPSMILWSSVALKDALVTLVIVGALYCCVLLKRRFTVGALFGLAAFLVAVQPLRFYMLYFLGFAVVVSLFMERGVKLVSGIYKPIFIIAVFAGMLALTGIAGRAESGMSLMSFERVSNFRHGMAVTAQSGFNADADVSTPGRAILFLPLGLSELLLGPFPWQFGSRRAMLAAPETILWWFMFPAVLRSMWWMTRKRFGVMSPLLVFAVTLSCAYSLMHGNIGSGFRQRAQIFVILFIFAALGHYQSKCRRAGLDPNLLIRPDEDAPQAPRPAAVAPPAVANARGA